MTSFSKPFVSVVIPCRNEEKFIRQCLESVIKQDYPQDKLEILVVDGASDDKTKEITGEFSSKHPFVKILDNPKKFTPFGLNIGIKAASGQIIIRMDSHAGYQKDYISKCIYYLDKFKADNVGGTMVTRPAKNTPSARAIAKVLSAPLGAASIFRLGSKEPMEVDTVFGGCYKKEVFDKIGMFDERMIRSQDIELNRRLKKSGGKIVFVPEIVSSYHPQATFKGFIKHNFNDGFWVTYPLKFGIKYFSIRHLIPLFLAGGLSLALFLSYFSLVGKALFVLAFGPYLFFVVLVSLLISLRGNLEDCPFLIFAFLIRHFAYGFGSIAGLIKSIVGSR